MRPPDGEAQSSACRGARPVHRAVDLYVGSAIDAAKVSVESGVDPVDRTKEVHLADIDAVVAEDRVGHRDMEIDVWDRHLQQVVLAAKHFSERREGEADLPVGGTDILRLVHALHERDSLPDA